MIENATVMAHKIAAALLRFSIVSSPICGRATRLLIVAVQTVQRPRYVHQIAIAFDGSRNIAEVVVEFFQSHGLIDGGVRLRSAEPGENDCGDAAAPDQRMSQAHASAQVQPMMAYP